jgi:GAF domain-containing protein
MKKSSRAGGESIKGRRRKAPEPKRRHAPKGQASSPAKEEPEVARLIRELTDERRQRIATSEVLRLLSGSHGDLNYLFDTILANATNLCQANFGTLSLCEGDAFRIVAMHNVPTGLAELRRREPLVRAGPLLRMAETKRLLHIADYMEYVASHPADRDAAAFAKFTGVRTILEVPMLKDDDLVGAIVIYRKEVRRFDDREIALANDFAAQAVIAIENARMLNELKQRTIELTEALEQQTATSEVLQVVSSSPADLDPVFGTMLEQAVRICDAAFGNIYRWDGEALEHISGYRTPTAFAEARRRFRLRPAPKSPVLQMVETKSAVHIGDLAQEPAYLEPTDPGAVEAVELGGIRTQLLVPMLKAGELVGAFAISRREVRRFSDKQIALITNFAAQAVIAIENARLLNELRQRTDDLGQRTSDLTEALERQTATSDVLQVISSSPGDLEAIFASMLEKAVRICDAKFGSILRWENEAAHLVATHNAPPAFAKARRRTQNPANPETSFGRMVASKAVVHVADAAAEPGYVELRDPAAVAAVELGGQRTALYVPMLKEGELMGALSLSRQEVRPFTDKQIELVQNFAAQAVIAIENARLLNELRQRTTDLTERTADLTEALEQQTATSEVLQVISSSPGDLQPVFGSMLENVVRICDASFGNIYRWDGEALHLLATQNTPIAFAEALTRSPSRPHPKNVIGRMLTTKKVTHIADAAASQAYAERHPATVAAVELGGVRSVLTVPLLKENKLAGAFALARQEVRPFTDKQIELVKNFAAQAVIAIENARLLNELRQSLERQTATSMVLQVISSSLGDLEPVFATMLENAARICDAKFGNIYRWDGEALHLLATHNTPPAFAEERRSSPYFRPGPKDPVRRMMMTKAVVHIDNVATTEAYAEREPAAVASVELGGTRTLIIVPMLKDDELIGAVTLARQEVRPFTDEQITLVTNFAAQAVIAIENARLLSELRERTKQVEAQSQELVELNQQLEQRVADQVGEIERMSRLRRFLPPQVADLIVASGSEKQLESHRREITALFCDLRGFTGFTESADAEDVMALLRDYHAAIGEIIIKYNGTLERYAGDGVMVVFNDPVPVENPALQAVLMALELRDAIGALTATWSRLGHEIGFGIGIAHGFATLGTIGFEGRFDYAAIGTVSNVASRLCDEAKPGQILISPRVLMKVENAVKVEPVGEFELKGIRRPLAAYNVVGAISQREG